MSVLKTELTFLENSNGFYCFLHFEFEGEIAGYRAFFDASDERESAASNLKDTKKRLIKLLKEKVKHDPKDFNGLLINHKTRMFLHKFLSSYENLTS